MVNEQLRKEIISRQLLNILLEEVYDFVVNLEEKEQEKPEDIAEICFSAALAFPINMLAKLESIKVSHETESELGYKIGAILLEGLGCKDNWSSGKEIRESN